MIGWSTYLPSLKVARLLNVEQLIVTNQINDVPYSPLIWSIFFAFFLFAAFKSLKSYEKNELLKQKTEVSVEEKNRCKKESFMYSCVYLLFIALNFLCVIKDFGGDVFGVILAFAFSFIPVFFAWISVVIIAKMHTEKH